MDEAPAPDGHNKRAQEPKKEQNNNDRFQGIAWHNRLPFVYQFSFLVNSTIFRSTSSRSLLRSCLMLWNLLSPAWSSSLICSSSLSCFRCSSASSFCVS